MYSKDSRTDDLLAKLAAEHGIDGAAGSRISRRGLLRSSASTGVISVLGIGGLLELLANREAVAAGNVIALVGVTREPDQAEETPHRHTFAATFQVTSVSPSQIIGAVFGRTAAVISTSSVREDQHFHQIQMSGVSLEELILSGTENNEAGGHRHLVSVE